MTASLAAYGLEKLTVEEQLALIGALWENVTAMTDRSLLTESQRAELLRRVADDDANPDNCVPWEEVHAAAMKRIGS